MKIVIDIDDEQVLFDIKNRGLEAQTETDKVIINALYNGTPLPKGHGRLIDADELKKTQHDIYIESIGYRHRCISVENIDEAPTIIQAENEEE